jgi:hypothetical protein
MTRVSVCDDHAIRARVLANLGLANNVELAHFAALRGLLGSAP